MYARVCARARVCVSARVPLRTTRAEAVGWLAGRNPSDARVQRGSYATLSLAHHSSALPASASAASPLAGLMSVDLPESVVLLGRGAFASCSGLTSIRLPEHLSDIMPGG